MPPTPPFRLIASTVARVFYRLQDYPRALEDYFRLLDFNLPLALDGAKGRRRVEEYEPERRTRSLAAPSLAVLAESVAERAALTGMA